MPPLSRLAATAIALDVLLGVGAVGGGLALMAGPAGEIIPLPVAALAGSCFPDYFVPGAILFVVLGLGPLGVAMLAWRRHPAAPLLTAVTGAALVVWLAVEVWVVGYSNDPPLQMLYFGLGVVLIVIGVLWWRATRGRLRPTQRNGFRTTVASR